jgi:hypothetical protein
MADFISTPPTCLHGKVKGKAIPVTGREGQ